LGEFFKEELSLDINNENIITKDLNKCSSEIIVKQNIISPLCLNKSLLEEIEENVKKNVQENLVETSKYTKSNNFNLDIINENSIENIIVGEDKRNFEEFRPNLKINIEKNELQLKIIDIDNDEELFCEDERKYINMCINESYKYIGDKNVEDWLRCINKNSPIIYKTRDISKFDKKNAIDFTRSNYFEECHDFEMFL